MTTQAPALSNLHQGLGRSSRFGCLRLFPRRPVPVCLLSRRPRPVGAGCGAQVGRSGAERADCAAVLGLAAHCATHCAPFGRSVQTSAMKVLTNALRAGRKPSAPRRPTGAPHPAPTGLGRRALGGGGVLSSDCSCGGRLLVCSRAEGTASRTLLSSVAAGGARWGRVQRRAEERRRRGGARSALRKLTHRHCLNGAREARAVSLAMRPGGEHRRSVGAFSARPRRCSPPPGTACRDARQRQGSSRSATGNEARQRQGSSGPECQSQSQCK